MMYKIIKALFIVATAFFARDVMARDREFNPMKGMEVLTHGETEVASFPANITCCSVTPINVPSSLTEYEEGSFSELHVTTVGSLRYPARDGEKGLYNRIYSSINRPASYSQFAFDVEHRYSSVCDQATSGLETSCLKSSVASCSDKAKVDFLKSTIQHDIAKASPKEVAFTFFGPRKSPKETAVIRCWPLEDEVLVGALLRNNKKESVTRTKAASLKRDSKITCLPLQC